MNKNLTSILLPLLLIWYFFFHKKEVTINPNSVDSGNTFGNTPKPTITTSKAYSIANQLYDEMYGWTDVDKLGGIILNEMGGLNEGDYKLIFEQFGERSVELPLSDILGVKWNLTTWLKNELSTDNEYYQALKSMFPNIF